MIEKDIKIERLQNKISLLKAALEDGYVEIKILMKNKRGLKILELFGKENQDLIEKVVKEIIRDYELEIEMLKNNNNGRIHSK